MDNMKYHLARWEMACKPLYQGGLGIHYVEEFNKALLGK